jgi:hypothetical protein
MEYSLGYIVIAGTILHLLITLYLLKKNNFVFNQILKTYMTQFYVGLMGIVAVLSVGIDIVGVKQCEL